MMIFSLLPLVSTHSVFVVDNLRKTISFNGVAFGVFCCCEALSIYFMVTESLSLF